MATTAVGSSLETFRHIVTLKDGVRVLFRPLTAQDYDGLSHLYIPLSPDDRDVMRQHVTEEVVRGWIDNLNYDHILPIVAEVHREIIGEATLHYGKGPYRHTAEVRIFLAHHWRQRGIGTRLLQTVVDLARRQGLQILTAEIIATHVHVIKAFETLGFQTMTRLDDYFMLPGGRTLDVALVANYLVSHSGEF
jgi:L-amino acid N-acyltransferase YncA